MKIESSTPPTSSTPTIARLEELQRDIFLCVVCLFVLASTSPQNARLTSLYEVVIDNRGDCLKMFRGSKDENDRKLVHVLRDTFPDHKSISANPLWVSKKERKEELDPYYAPLVAFHHRTKDLPKKGWVGELKKDGKGNG